MHHLSRWQCPSCGGNILAEVTNGATVSTRIDGVSDKGMLIFGAHEEVAGGTPSHYQCSACGERVKDGPVTVTTRRHMARLLQEMDS